MSADDIKSHVADPEEDVLIQHEEMLDPVLRKFISLLSYSAHTSRAPNLIIGLAAAAADSALLGTLAEGGGEIVADWLELTDDNTLIFKYAVSISTAVSISALDIYATNKLIDQIKILLGSIPLIPNSIKYFALIILIAVLTSGMAAVAPAGLLYVTFKRSIGGLVLSVLQWLAVFFGGVYFVQEAAGKIINNVKPRSSELANQVSVLKGALSNSIHNIGELGDVEFGDLLGSLKSFRELQHPTLEDAQSLLVTLEDLFSGGDDTAFLAVAQSDNRYRKLVAWLPACFCLAMDTWLFYYVSLSALSELTDGDPEAEDPNAFSMISTSAYMAFIASLGTVSFSSIGNSALGFIKKCSRVITGEESFGYDDLCTMGKGVLSCVMGSAAGLVRIELIKKYFYTEKTSMQYMAGIGSYMAADAIKTNALIRVPLKDLIQDICFEIGGDCVNKLETKRRQFQERLKMLRHVVDSFSDEDIRDLYLTLTGAGLMREAEVISDD